MGSQIVAKLSPDAARSLHQQGPQDTEADALGAVAEELGVVLRPMHPGTEDPDLMTYFMAESPDLETANRLIHRLQEFESVEAAYVKPPDEPP
jgi:hypothetical protein